MLFDLRGRRRRAVQATYLTLALLMGGGLVFFGIGGDVSGGLFDAFSERGGGGNGNEAIEKRIDANEKRRGGQRAGYEGARARLLPARHDPDRSQRDRFPGRRQGRARQGRHVLDALPQDHGEARRLARQGGPPDLRRHRLEQTEGRAGRRRSSPRRRTAPPPISPWSSTRRSPATRARPTWPGSRPWTWPPGARRSRSGPR